MTDDAAQLNRIERERRRREAELLLWLLALCATARRDAAAIAVHGGDPSFAIRAVITGMNGLRGATPLFAKGMAQAHRYGYRRAGLMAGTRALERADAGTLTDLMNLYEPAAHTAASELADTLAAKVYAALVVARAEGATGNAIRRAVRDGFDAAGYSKRADHGADRGVERAIVTAHNNGILGAVFDGSLAGVVTGLRHRSVLDEATTDICRERDGLQLPLEDDYWRRGVPQLHWRCRSTLIVLTDDFDPSDWRPQTPPMIGFGYPPPGFIEGLMRRRAA